jgi:formylglycine-generating enzyme required for sulfatase activity
MNLTSQYIINPKSREAYLESLASHKTIRPTITRLRMSDDRYVLNSRKRASFQVEGIGFNMLYCPRGRFMMDDEKTLTAIERPFLLGETEVTQELFEKIMGFNSSNFQGGNYPNSNQRPVEMVTSYDAMMFCNKLSLKLGKRPYYNISSVAYKKETVKSKTKKLPNIQTANVTINPQANGFRLPYSKEWEYAAKAGTNNKYAGVNDDQFDQVAWFEDNSNDQTHPVKGKRPNEWGFYDMIGNIWELCYDEDDLQVKRKVHGCSWDDKAYSLISGKWKFTTDGYASRYIGFRISASLVK